MFRGEFAEEMKGQKPMDVKVLARQAIAGIEAGKLEISPGLSNVLRAMSRIASQFMLKQMAKGKPKNPRPNTGLVRCWAGVCGQYVCMRRLAQGAESLGAGSAISRVRGEFEYLLVHSGMG